MREGHLVETWEEAQREMRQAIRWPTVGINSDEYQQLRQYERFRHLAIANLDSAKSLCLQLGEHPEQLNWPRASVVTYCCYHAAELFLKACILYRSPAETGLGHHDVARLKIRYHELCPWDKFFAFQRPWDLRLQDVEKAFGVPSSWHFEDQHDQVYRYL